MKFRLLKDIHSDSLGVYMYENRGNSLAVVPHLTMTALGPFEAPPTEPTLRINATEAQQLVDELWDAGLRPSEGSGSAGSLAATERHLADMRKIAFAALERDGIETVSEIKA